MDPITIGLLLASTAGGLYASDRAGKTASESLDFQKQRAAEQDRLAQATRVDAFGNVVKYDPFTNTWRTDLTPGQSGLLHAGETEQRRQLTVDAAQNRAVRDRMYRAGTLAQPGLDEAIARYRFGGGDSEESIRSKIAQLLTAAKSAKGGDLSPDAIRTRGNLPALYRTPTGDTGASELAKTLLQARGQGLTEYGTRQNQRQGQYGNAIGTYANLLSGGGNAPITMPTIGKDLEAQQNAMAQLVASVGASGSANIGQAQAGALKAASMNPFDAKGNAALIAAMGRYSKTGGKTGATPQASSTGPIDTGTQPDNSYIGDPWYQDPWYQSSTQFA